MQLGLENPISMSFNLLQSYRSLLGEVLQRSHLSQEDIAAVLAHIKVDRGVIFSLNRKYQPGRTSFRQFCLDHGILEQLADLIPFEQLFVHQEEAITSILGNTPTVISTGTGSGKTESFLIPIIDYCLQHPGNGVKAVIVYPMNALANDQLERLARYTANTDITFGVYVGSTPPCEPVDEEDKPIRLSPGQLLYRSEMHQRPPNILITNYVMLDWMLTGTQARQIFTRSRDTAKYIVLDEIHSYRGNKATHLMCLLRRLKALLNEAVLPIGASATLQKADQTGYLGGDSLGDFLKPLLGVETYHLVEPTFLPEPELQPGPSPTFSAHTDYGWVLTLDPGQALNALSRLTGESYSEYDLEANDFSETRMYRTLQRDPFVLAIKQLLMTGSRSFNDLVKKFQQVYPDSPAHKSEEIVQAYLSAIAYINQQAKSAPLLDFRIHLFLKDVGGHLKRCLKCKNYHSGLQKFCPDCGFPLFLVYRHNINQCIGKLTGNGLKYELRPESDDKKNSFYVLLEFMEGQPGSPGNGRLRFETISQPDNDQFTLSYSDYGQLQLERLPVTRYEDVEPLLVSLVDGAKDFQYLHHLVKSVLDYHTGQDKKLLGFVDNREKASRFSTVLRDEFAEQFLEEFLKLHYPPSRRLNLVLTLEHLLGKIPPQEQLSPLEQAIFKELPLWYARYISMPARMFDYKTGLLRIKDIELFEGVPRELMDIFLTERAIDKRGPELSAAGLKLVDDPHFIRFQRYWATQQRGIRFTAQEESELPNYPSISLSKDAREHAEFVDRYDMERDILPALRLLIDQGFITEKRTADDKINYYLNPCRLYLEPGPPQFSDYESLRDNLLLTADLHSAELSSKRRQMVENEFKQSKLNFLLATPTLEMGIDIGQLQNVLLLGVPPLPSNYAQRSGRAGRTQGNNYALLVTFCMAGNNHDMFYFHRPEQMINGVISPPTFNPANAEVIKKHVNAWVLADELQDTQQLNAFFRNLDNLSDDSLLARTAAVFGDIFDVPAYLTGPDFKATVRNLMERGQFQGRNLRSLCYAEGTFPDYMFRRDMIPVLEKDTFQELQQNGKGLAGRELSDYALSEREPEQAYYKFAPGETVYMAGGIYKVLPDGNGRHLLEAAALPVYSYDYFLSDAVVGFASKSKQYIRYARSQQFDGEFELANDTHKVVRLYYHQNCALLFRNKGVKRFDEVEPFKNGQENFAIGYNLNRQGILLEFDRRVCADSRLYLSLVSALDRRIKDDYGLDESELRLLVGVTPLGQEPDDAKIWIMLYDFDGNDNLPLRRIFNDFIKVAEKAYEKLNECTCESGCYQCLKSYSTHIYADNVDKATALMFLGYLSGRNPFKPSIVPAPLAADETGLVLEVKFSGSTFTVTAQPGGKSYPAEINGSHNGTLFNLLRRAICAEFKPAYKTLRVVTRQDWLANAINQGEVNKDREAFAELQFHLLRFAGVSAVKG